MKWCFRLISNWMLCTYCQSRIGPSISQWVVLLYQKFINLLISALLSSTPLEDPTAVLGYTGALLAWSLLLYCSFRNMCCWFCLYLSIDYSVITKFLFNFKWSGLLFCRWALIIWGKPAIRCAILENCAAYICTSGEPMIMQAWR